MPSPEEIKLEKRRFLIRTISISALLIINVLIIYLYYYVLVFNSIEMGKVYGDSTFNGGRYEIYTLKYYYQHKNITYFDKIDYVMTKDLEVGDSLVLRVLNPYPPKHMIKKVIRNESKKPSYHHEDGLKTEYHIHIEKLRDYEPQDANTLNTPNDNKLILSTNTSAKIKTEVIKTIDNVRFNRGSLIEYFILKSNQDSITLHSVYHYLNDFSIDAMPSRIIYQQLNNSFPDKKISISILDKNNPKRERKLEI